MTPGAIRPEIAEIVRKIDEIRPQLCARAPEGDQLRRVPEESFDAIAATGALTISVPTRFGGLAACTREIQAVSRAIARGDAGAAWVQSILDSGAWVLSLMDDRAQEDVWGAGGGIDDYVSLVLATSSHAERVPGGYLVTGRWEYGTGSLHAKWSVLGIPIPDEDGSLIDAGLCLIPTSELEVEDNWFVAGMKSSGSVTQLAQSVFVPEHRVISVTAAVEGGYLGENPEPSFATVFIPSLFMRLVGSHLGMGRAALDYVVSRADDKSIAFTGYEKQADSAVFQTSIARACILLQTAETMAGELADEIYDNAARNYYAPYRERIEMRAKAGWIVETITQMIDGLVTLHGSAGFADTCPLQRIWRDQATASRHGHTLAASGFEAFGKIILGREDAARKVLPVI